MYQLDWDKPGKGYFIGIGGISMSGFARLLQKEGFQISGSDRSPSSITTELERAGIAVSYVQDGSSLTGDFDFVVYTSAISPDNPEFQKARSLNLPMMERGELVGQVMLQYKTAVAVAGTHGKTTTTSITSHIMLEAGFDPTISVGGILPAIQGNMRIGNSEYFIAEACEYTNSFLKFHPTMGIILNIEAEHLDFFQDLQDIRNSFRRFASLIPSHGVLAINADIPDYEEIIEGLTCHVITYSANDESADFYATDILFDSAGCPTFTLVIKGEKKDTYHLSIPGKFNISNALGSLCLAYDWGVDPASIQTAFDSYHGTNRRFQKKGEYNGAVVIDDYAHHPTEIAATLDAATSYPHRKLYVAFQPHTYSRTKAFLTDFAKVLSAADTVLLADIYAARETDDLQISSKDLAHEMKKLGADVHYLGSFEAIENFLKKNLLPNDMLITMGAGNIVDVGESLLKE